MSARTFVEWQAYCAIEPFGPQAEFWRAGMVTAMIANVHRGKTQKPFKPEDFMPKELVLEEPQQLSDEHQALVLRQNFEAYQAAQKATKQ